MSNETHDKKKYQRIMDLSGTFREWSCTRWIGSGTFGTVVEIRKKKGGEVSALKVIPIPLTENELREKQQELGDDPAILKLEFQDQINKVREKEIGVLEKCRGQQNIVQIYESDVVPNPTNPVCSYILIRMELLFKIEDYLRGKTQRDVLKMFRDIAQALDFLESRRMLHRDIKRANIMISQSGDCKLTDFGEARDILTKNAASTKAGTPYFMAPEVWFGQRYDSRADIYSLAMTVYNCLYQFRYPFQQLGTQSQISANDANQQRLAGYRIPPIPNVDDRLNQILLKCLEYEPSDRYPSARALLEDINKLLQIRSFGNEKLIFPGKTSPGPGPTPKKLTGLIWAIAGGAVALVGIIAAVILLQPGPVPPNPNRPTPTPFVETIAVAQVEQIEINNKPAGESPLQVSEGTISIRWNASGEVDHYLLTVKDGQGRSIIGPNTIEATKTSAFLSANQTVLLTQEEIYTVELCAVAVGGSEEDALAKSAQFFVKTGAEDDSTGNHKVTYTYDETAPSNPPVPPIESSYPAGSEVMVADDSAITMTGYQFMGWKVDGVDVVDDKFIMPDRDVLIIGSWLVEEHKVTYIYDGETPAGAPLPPEESLHTYNTQVTVADYPECEGYTFSGWSIGNFTMPSSDVIIHGSWTINRHQVSYSFEGAVPEGVETLPDATYDFGETVILPDVPEVEGYVFTWSVNGTAVSGNSFTLPDEDVTVVGTWVPGSYSVTYRYDGDIPKDAPALPGIEAYDYGAEVTVANLPSQAGYSVVEWRGEDAVIVDGKFTMPGHNVELTGTWEANPHSVNYVYTGSIPKDAPQAPKTEVHRFGETVMPIEPDTMEGYTFSGWDRGEFKMPDGDVTLSGKWIVNQHRVNYEYNGFVPDGVSDSLDSMIVSYGEQTYTAGVPSITGYSFSGWTAKNVIVASDGGFTMPDDNVTFTGSWAPNIHTVSYAYTGDVPDGAEATLPKARVCAYGKTIQNDIPRLKGYGFSGWSSQSIDVENDRFIMPDADVVFTGSWEIGVYSVSYRYEGTIPVNVPALPASAQYSYDQTVELFQPEMEGYTFEGWTAQEDVVDVKDGNSFAMPDSDVVLTGSWVKNHHAVRYVYDDSASVNVPDPAYGEIYSYGERVELPMPTMMGYTFNGWVAEGVEVAADNTFIMPDAEVSFVGSWTINRHKIYFQYDESAPEDAPVLPEAEEFNFGEKIAVTISPKMQGYGFFGWTTEDAQMTGNTFIMPDTDVTLTGSWKRNTHTVHFAYDETASDDVPAPADSKIYGYGDVVELPIPVSTGYTFNRWYADSVEITEDGRFIMPDFDVYLIGSWSINQHIVSFRYDGNVPKDAPAVPKERLYNYGDRVELPKQELKGYSFFGWTADGVEVIDGFGFDMPDFDVEVYGRWEEVHYTVTFDPAGGQPIPEPQSVSAFGTATPPDVPSCPGQKFVDWMLGGEPYDFNTPVTGDITLTANWVLDLRADVPSPLRCTPNGDAYMPQDIFIKLADGSDLTKEQKDRVSIVRVSDTDSTTFASNQIKWSRHGIEFGDAGWVDGATYTLHFMYDGVEFDRHQTVCSIYIGNNASTSGLLAQQSEETNNAQNWELSMAKPEHLWMRVVTLSNSGHAPAFSLYGLDGGGNFGSVGFDRLTAIQAEMLLPDGQTQCAWMWDVTSKWGDLQGTFGTGQVLLNMNASFTEIGGDTDIVQDQPYEVFWNWIGYDEETMRAKLRTEGYVFPDEAVEEKESVTDGE